MKKISIMASIVLLSSTIASARVFVGIQAGYDMGKFESVLRGNNGVLGSSAFSAIQDHNFYAGLDVGTEHIYNYVGFRWFVGVGYTSAFETAEINLGVDFLLNFLKSDRFSMGFYVGVGSSFQALINPALKGEIPILGRTGLSFGLGEHNRIDIGVQIPIITWSIEAFDKPFGIMYSPIRTQIGYKYIF
ncbi:hypothetical protein CQA53_05520 [Helicobacter didelphidarum]|uniref:Outer membrane beta-barrel protein n=1 Tax=Helicobacter didelphidarum TaxID=2040648 RepID=A0A3D8IKX4_9HELI|nr:hypothetical protein [Helicobacter didelphidarum]RDU65902.1 hypothetical protein CQA53_05520 [Helicobacter didelphidarum]